MTLSVSRGRPSVNANIGIYPYTGTSLAELKIAGLRSRDGYARELVCRPGPHGRAHWAWRSAPGATAAFSGVTSLTTEQAAELGRLMGRCVACLRPLTDPVSCARGYGPTCARRLGL